MTYPLIGNYGITEEDTESKRPHALGFVVRELTKQPSSFRSQMDLDTYLNEHDVPGIEGIDTRALVRRIRTAGAMTGVLSCVDLDSRSLVEKARSAPVMLGQDLVREVVPGESFQWSKGFESSLVRYLEPRDARCHVVALDYGMKWNILRCLTQVGCRVTVLPGTASSDDVLSLDPDGIFLSNGPGDPEPLDYAIATIQKLIGKKPIFGICLGHQVLSLALGAKTFKLKFGHRGANQPVLNRLSDRVEITTQNHGFAVDKDSLPPHVHATHVNLNDGTLEGLRHQELPVMSVQYHPEASAGPHDSSYLFEEFRAMM